MFSIRNLAGKTLFARNTYNLGFGKKRKPTPSDLEKYDVVVVGAGLGSVFASHLDAVVGEKYKIFVSYDNQVTYYASDRTHYEMGNITKFNYGGPTRQIVCKNIGQSDYVGVEKINPDANEVVLRNGRTIKYENLVIAAGQKENFQSIKGFDDAWADVDSPFYTNSDHPTWKASTAKGYRVHYNFNGGPAYFYIPPGNFYGEIENYNFLISKAMWDQQANAGKLSWESSSFTIINPNRTFCSHFKKVDDYLKNACYENNINIETDLTLVEVRKTDNVAVFKNRDGELVERPFGHFYSMLPTTANPLVSDAGLADSTGYLNVDPETLQHKQYSNIFGVGDVLNVPTTKTFLGGLSQVAVVRHNVERKLNGLSLNAKYDGYSKASLYTGPGSIANVEHKYGGEEVSFATDGFSSKLRATLHSKHGAENILKFKNWGPPYYKLKKTFEGGDSSLASVASKLTPEKKTA